MWPSHVLDTRFEIFTVIVSDLQYTLYRDWPNLGLSDFLKDTIEFDGSLILGRRTSNR